MSSQTDISTFLKSLDDLMAKATVGAMRGVDMVTQKIVKDAQELAPVGGGKYSPRDPAPGSLKASIHAEPPTIEGTTITAEIGSNLVYAAVQHERLDFRHDQGQAKYLETALNANGSELTQYVKDAVQKELSK